MNTKRREAGDIEIAKFSDEDIIKMDLEYEQYGHANPLDMNDMISTDLSEIVDSICKDDSGGLPYSPPDSVSEHLMSPSVGYVNVAASTSDDFYLSTNHQRNPSKDYASHNILPDLSKVNYTLPMQMLEDDYKSVVVQGGSVVYKDQSDMHVHLKRRKSGEDKATNPQKILKTELPLSPDHLVVSPSSSSNMTENSSVYHFPNSIRFNTLFAENWMKMATERLIEIKPPQMIVTADKGFNFSTQDDAFIVQKKNHFQVTCDIQLTGTPRFVKKSDGTLHDISYLQVNFYGIKSDIPSTHIKIEQSQADRTKKEFHPVRLDLSKNGTGFQVTVGRLHFAETTSNNMRKKGKPNPAQKYFQLVVSLEAIVVGTNNKKTHFEVAKMASERVIVRASNPGQFESDNEPPWTRDQNTDTVFHMGRVAINTDQGSEALTVHGNIQVSGQVMQPSDRRIKNVIREVDPREQLQNVNNIKIVQYKYKPEYLKQLPEEERHRLEEVPHTGIIAQDIRKVLPDAVSSSGPYVLANGKEIDDMLIVDKDRLFLENIGAVRELSKVTGSLGLRLEDLEKANESVTVRLSKLRRGGSVKSTTSSIISGPEIQHKFSPSKTLFQNKCVQAIILALVAIMAISLVSIATVYIIDYHERQDEGNLSSNINVTKPIFTKGDEAPTRPFEFTTSSSTTSTKSTTTSTSIVILEDVPVIGALDYICSYDNPGKCQFFCCHENRTHFSEDSRVQAENSHFSSHESFAGNSYIALIEPDHLTTQTTTTSTTESSLTLSISDLDDLAEKEKLIELQERAHEKINQVLDDVTKQTPTVNNIKEDKINDLKLGKELTSTEKPAGVKARLTTIKSLKKEDNDIEVDIEGEYMNEVIDFNEAPEAIKAVNESSRLNVTDMEEVVEPQPQRAKRDIAFGEIREQLGNLVRGLVRRIRDTGQALIHDQKSSRSQLFITGPIIGNNSIDGRYCDRNSSPIQLRDCRQNQGFNRSFEIPISRHFHEEFITLNFVSHGLDVEMCPLDISRSPNCDESHQDPDVSIITEGNEQGSFRVFVGVFSSIEVRFRVRRRFVNDPDSHHSLCSLTDNKLGALFEEYNLRFYRICHA